MKFRPLRHPISLLAALLTALAMTSVHAETGNADAAAIRTLLSKTYDKPEHKVETAPVVVADGFALADWIQGSNGGRALLRRQQDKWEIVACGGDGFKDVGMLKDAGIPAATAKALIAKLNEAERSISPDRVKRFSLFGMQGGSQDADHHAPPKP
ncbi:copper uptake system-associated protein [Burkholderia alba]|uniref:copper uptake system-associated protein n=1 Tax=Burkholderia alba TaxID=2683677 RepID=UPI002B057600|nr:copper uptake system-associated protein [Burkholderia alba]